VATHGARRLRSIEIIDSDGRSAPIACDLLAVSNGWSPTVHLTCHLGGKPMWNDALNSFVPGQLPPGLTVAGAASGRITLAPALADGARIGAEDAADCGFGKPAGGEMGADDEGT